MPGGPRFQVILDHKPNLGIQVIGNVPDAPDPVEMACQYFSSKQAVVNGNNSSNLLALLAATFAVDFGGALVALAGLAFLGLGAEIGSPEWGSMLAEGQALLFGNPAAALAPALAIILLAIAVNLIGDWVYDRYTGQ
jgi:ABC-type antimicrobial peptide transport system permease subunit